MVTNKIFIASTLLWCAFNHATTTEEITEVKIPKETPNDVKRRVKVRYRKLETDKYNDAWFAFYDYDNNNRGQERVSGDIALSVASILIKTNQRWLDWIKVNKNKIASIKFIPETRSDNPATNLVDHICIELNDESEYRYIMVDSGHEMRLLRLLDLLCVLRDIGDDSQSQDITKNIEGAIKGIVKNYPEINLNEAIEDILEHYPEINLNRNLCRIALFAAHAPALGLVVNDEKHFALHKVFLGSYQGLLTYLISGTKYYVVLKGKLDSTVNNTLESLAHHKLLAKQTYAFLPKEPYKTDLEQLVALCETITAYTWELKKNKETALTNSTEEPKNIKSFYDDLIQTNNTTLSKIKTKIATVLQDGTAYD